MTKNPYLNALAALGYITIVASFMFFGMEHSGPDNSVIIPIAMLSLFTFSAAMMSYIFFYQPVMLYLDGKKKEAVDLFTKTLLTFGCITFAALVLLISGIFR